MERPRTGPMQFPGEIQPGVYLDWETVRMLFTADEAVALREIRQAFNGIQPVQRARLEEHVAAGVRALKEALDKGTRTPVPDYRSRTPLVGHCVDCGIHFDAVEAALFALEFIQEFKRA